MIIWIVCKLYKNNTKRDAIYYILLFGKTIGVMIIRYIVCFHQAVDAAVNIDWAGGFDNEK